jgi:hypothetical protein
MFGKQIKLKAKHLLNLREKQHMKYVLSVEHKKQFEQIKRDLVLIGARESNFLKVELLFYDAMKLAREYGDEVEENGLLAAFKHLQANEYQQTKALFNKSIQRERVIRRFINSFKSVLSAAMKNTFLQPQST